MGIFDRFRKKNISREKVDQILADAMECATRLNSTFFNRPAGQAILGAACPYGSDLFKLMEDIRAVHRSLEMALECMSPSDERYDAAVRLKALFDKARDSAKAAR